MYGTRFFKITISGIKKGNIIHDSSFGAKFSSTDSQVMPMTRPMMVRADQQL
jgi:hypothetical protein